MIVDQGTNAGMVLVQVLNFAILTALLALPVLTLFMLFRARPGSDLALVLWVLVIIAFPVIGPVAFMMYRFMQPNRASAPMESKEPHAG